MTTPESFISELEAKHHDAFRRLVVTGYLPALAGEGVSIADLLRWESKQIIEAIEIAALWIADTDSLELKMILAEAAGRHAKNFRSIEESLGSLGLAPGSYDPRQGGYSKLFGFWRSLQTSEERIAAGLWAAGTMAVERLTALAAICEEQGQTAAASLCRDILVMDEQHRIDTGREKLIHLAIAEDSQARSRRAVFRTVELFTEIHDTAAIRRSAGLSGRKA
jgi:hypothetical protein